jgi:hypothetical protein
MAESEEESPPKQLVRAANGDYWLVKKGAIPEPVHSHDPNRQPQKPELVNFITTTNENLATLFDETNPGVKLGLTVVDFDDQY